MQAEGLFDAARKRPLPAFPRRLGVITSPSGAAVRDVLQVLRRRAPHLAVTIYPSQVQGAEAAAELREALAIALQRADCDILLLTRGGGSIEDLAAFNDESLARSIASAQIPIVSAVGHEIDFTIADFVADRRAPTPSAAAEMISPDGEALNRTVAAYLQRLLGALRRRTVQDRRQLERLQGRLHRAAPVGRLRQHQQRLDSLDLRLLRSMRERLRSQGQNVAVASRRLLGQSPLSRLQLLAQRLAPLRERLDQAWHHTARRSAEQLSAAARQLHAVSPLATMQRGYAILRHPERHTVVTQVAQVAVGEQLEALLVDGRLGLRVDRIAPDSPAADKDDR